MTGNRGGVMLTFPDWPALVYIGVMEGALLTALVALYVCRRRAPRACRLGMLGFGGLLFFNAAVLSVSPLLVYHVQTGDVVAHVLWRLQVLLLLSALVNAGAVLVVTAAILSERAQPTDGGGD